MFSCCCCCCCCFCCCFCCCCCYCCCGIECDTSLHTTLSVLSSFFKSKHANLFIQSSYFYIHAHQLLFIYEHLNFNTYNYFHGTSLKERPRPPFKEYRESPGKEPLFQCIDVVTIRRRCRYKNRTLRYHAHHYCAVPCMYRFLLPCAQLSVFVIYFKTVFNI